MIIELMNFVPCIRKASSIHYMYTYRKMDGFNPSLFKLSPSLHEELYENKMPIGKGIRYYIARAIISQIGDMLFMKHSTYMHCDMTYSMGDMKTFESIYKTLSPSYKYLIRKDTIEY